MTPAIVAENLGKCYQIGHQRLDRAQTFREALAAAASSVGRQLLHPWRSAAGPRGVASIEEFWALREISFSIDAGERVGIIGRNGAGKSTLLKILSRITEPSTGQARIRGRVASLLEVGTGFHPELTGRENIFLNGAILGMSRAEIRRKFDAIVDFAEVERFLDTPVKRYSSGMYVRLAFAVAAHLEPEILIVDEVLAVGDAQFQQKCLGKMEEVGQEGRTVLFVSHNMGAVKRLCDTGIWLRDGAVAAYGPMDEVVARYVDGGSTDNPVVEYPGDPHKDVEITRVALCNERQEPGLRQDRTLGFSVVVAYRVNSASANFHVAVMLDTGDGIPVCHMNSRDGALQAPSEIGRGTYLARLSFPGNLLNAGNYRIRVGLANYLGTVYDYREPFSLQLEDPGTFAATGAGGRQRLGILAPPIIWEERRTE